MKRSELELIDDEYRLTPDNWGSEQSIIIDEEKAVAAMEEHFGEPCPLDDNLRDDKVEITTDGKGKFYAIMIPYEGTDWGSKTGIMHNENLYMECGDPNTDPEDGMIELYSQTWEMFDDIDE